MALAARVVRWGGLKVARRLSRTVPLVGTLVAVATVGAAMRRKGLLRGALDAGLDALPVVGAAKITIESVLGHDLLPDRPRSRAARDGARAELASPRGPRQPDRGATG